jgi:cell division protein FtsB
VRVVESSISRQRARLRLTGRALALLVLVAGLLVASIYPLRTYLHQHQQIGSLEQRMVSLEQRNRALERRMARLHDPAYLERLARECLGMVRRGETSFVVVPDNGIATPAHC